MHRFTLLLALLVIALPAAAQEQPRPLGQVPMLPLDAGEHADIETLLRSYWPPYFNTGHAEGFGRDAVRAGRFDIDGDGRAELFVMIEHPTWTAEHGQPLVVATWSNKGWNAVGWSWGDEDTVFVTNETIGGWRTIDTGTQLMRWERSDYGRTDK